MNRESEILDLNQFPYDWVIWDWNGTLLDDARLMFEMVNVQLAHYGAPLITFEQYRDSICHPPQDFFARWGVALDEEAFRELGSRYHRDYVARRHECSLQEGALELLQSLKTRGIKQALLSAHPHELLLDALNHYRLAEQFDRITGHPDHSAASKVETGRALLDEIGSAPSRVVLVGDSDHDHEVAEALGADCVLISRGLQSKPRLVASGRTVLDSLDELRRSWLD